MRRLSYRAAFMSFAGVTCLFVAGAAEPPAEEATLAELRKKPITTSKSELGELLTKWWQDGTAAGNAGDFYDNRDGAHSDLSTEPYPQLQRIVYTDDDIKNRRHWALTVGTRPHVTFGNSSTSAPPTMGGSNPRHAYCSTRGLNFLALQYKGNNVYIYPEHRDHDPGHNGHGDGYGDLYPTNTPYLLISQGSSGSDQPFMRAIPFTLAAFRPEVKKKLVESGLLIPTVQMILRSTNKQLTNPKDYLTGKAHPTVFEGSWVDALKMVKLAHEITAETIPPMVQLKVAEEDKAENGRDFFEPRGTTEKLGDTPAVIARLWRGKDGRRRMIVSAAESYDLNKKPLTFTWVVLRGDEKQIKITPKNEAGSEVEIVVPYHPRRPVTPGAALESNRVDIGVFVHNGTYYSAPGFITFCTLDNEARGYDEKGRILDVGYGADEVDVRVADYKAVFEALSGDAGLPARMFKLSSEQRARLQKVGYEWETQWFALHIVATTKIKDAEMVRTNAEKDLRAAQSRLDSTRKAHTDKPSEETKSALEKATKQVEDAMIVRKKTDDAVQTANKFAREAPKQLDELLARKHPELGATVNDFVDRMLRQARQNPDLFDTFDKDFLAVIAKAAPARKNAIEAARQRLLQSGLATNRDGGLLEWHPVRDGNTVLAKRLTPYEKLLLESFNATLLAELVLPEALTVSSAPNFVDQRLFAAKSWRDVYHYDAAGKLAGWTRYDGNDVTDFTDEGLMILEKDGVGRAIKARSVRYQQVASKEPGRPSVLKTAPGEEIVTFSYEDGKRVEKTRMGTKEER